MPLFARHGRAVLWTIASITTYALTGAAIRHVAEVYAVHPFQIAFFRNVLALVPVLVIMRLTGVPLLPRSNRLSHGLRGLFETGATLSWVLAVSLMPLANYSAINFTSILFAMAAAAVLLGERVGKRRMVSMAFGFVGVMVVLRPDVEGFASGGWAAVINAACAGMSRALTRHLGRLGAPLSIVAYTLLIGLAPVGLAAMFVWTNVGWPELLWFCAIAAGGFIAQFCLAAGYRSATVGEIASLEFLQIPIGTMVGYAAFGQIPDLQSLLGIAVILVAASYAMHAGRQGAVTT